MPVAASLVGAANTLTPGLRADFYRTYMQKYKAQDEMMSMVMDLSKKSDKRYELWAYYESAAYPRRWDLGDTITSKGFKSVNWQTYNHRFGHRINWQLEDEQDDQTDSLYLMAQEGGKHFATLDERIFFQMLLDSTDADLLPNVPNAPDGVAVFSATDGSGSDRFGVSGGNVLTAINSPTADDIRDQYYAAIRRFTEFLDTEGQPLLDPSDVAAGMVVIHGTELTRVMKEAFEQRNVIQQIGGSAAAAAPSNVIIDTGDNVKLWRTIRVTGKKVFFILTKPELKPLYRQERTPLKEDNAERANSDIARDTNLRYIQWHCRKGYGAALPYCALKAANT